MGLPEIEGEVSDDDLEKMVANATRAANFLKALGNESRLLILCYLANGEKSVSDLERLLSSRQSAVSQQLGRLRLEGFVVPRREGKAIYYSLADGRAREVIDLVYDLFCAED
jgi:DNA-binding transcriptional ArsR family regulator